ncbi:hypothetical protein GCM10007895_00970 [Paraferrimonas sedimenticola]|uniref:Uncharacterized protein n=2 Tax=Paraferrimonas sedimenticola TaxID=375674 RepID=A0AA37RT12_9GAMM|nr:hypothetical protein GCM10007895_00970 [Paraferrimonas sedimenticola]
MKTTHKAKLLAMVVAAALAGCSSDDPKDVTPEVPEVPQNNAPVAGEVAQATIVNQVITLDVVAVASDADGDEVSLVADSVSASVGDAVYYGGKISYFAPLGTDGEVTVSYTLTDGTDETAATATVTVEDKTMSVEYMGSQSCLGCHADHASFLETGHNFKINKVENDQAPKYPFSNIDGRLEQLVERLESGDSFIENILQPSSYADVTYVIGGYHWKNRWADADGYVHAGTGTQFNLQAEEGAADQWGNYKSGQVFKDGERLKDGYTYGCGGCHNTGYKRYDEELNPNRQWDLVGTGGTWELSGVQCEACHGAGNEHVDTMVAISNTPHVLDSELLRITRKATPRTAEALAADDMAFGQAVHCAECHTRDGERKYDSETGEYKTPYNKAFPEGSTYGGRIVGNNKGYGLGKHHQTIDELVGVNPATGEEMGKHFQAGLDCSSCHNPHKSTVNRDKPGHDGALKSVCTDCHTDQAPSGATHAALDCTSCHMPGTAKSAIYEDFTPMMGGGEESVRLGDVKGHIFKIDLSKSSAELEMDGFVYPAISRDQACGACHSESFREMTKSTVIH